MFNGKQVKTTGEEKSLMEMWIPEIGKVLGDCTGADLMRAIEIIEARAAAAERAKSRRLERLARLKISEAAQGAKSARPKLPRKA